MAVTHGAETAGQTRWGVVAAILALPALLVAGVVTLFALWLLIGS
ncbi:hypothetical protein ABZT17_11345 [Streptomyces sp. NPDC005648]